MKNVLLLFVLVMCGYMTMAMAAGDKVCYPSSGSPSVLQYNATTSLTADQNKAGSIILSYLSVLAGGGAVPFTCNCDSPTSSMVHWWSASSTFPVTQDGQYSWLQLTPSLQASVEIRILGSTGGPHNSAYHPIPFTGVANDYSEPCAMSGSASSGARGTITLRVIKPAVGHIEFNGKIASVWHYRKADYINEADIPEETINLSLVLDVPSGCVLLPGSTMNVDLGNNIQTDFKGQTYPEGPKSYTPRSFGLQFDCNFSTNALDVVLNGIVDGKGSGFGTSKDDVSVIVTNDEGKIIPPNTLAGTVGLVGDENISTKLILKAYPSNSGSQGVPASGAYNATVTILLSYN